MRTAAISRAFVSALLVAAAQPLPAQVAVGVRYGQGEGTAVYHVGEVNARVRALGRVYASAAFELIGGNWACVESPLDAIRCGYDGYSISAGPALALHDGDRLFLALSGAIGGFVRTGRYGGDEYVGDGKLTASLGIAGELAVAGPFRLQAGITHRSIFDDVYENAVGESPNFTTLTLGVGFAFGRRGRVSLFDR